MLFDWIKEQGHECVFWCDELDEKWVQVQNFDLGISYTYSRIISARIIQLLHHNIVNLHISFLPWNRGSDPNIWSLLEKTPRGVTLHYINEEVDKGDIIVQEIISSDVKENATLKSTYNELTENAIGMFKRAFGYYDMWKDMRKESKGMGSYHSDQQSQKIRQYISTFDMTVKEFRQKCEMEIEI